MHGGGVGGASGLVLYAAVFVLRGIILEFLIRDSRIVGLSTRQRTANKEAAISISNLLCVCDSFKEGSIRSYWLYSGKGLSFMD